MNSLHIKELIDFFIIMSQFVCVAFISWAFIELGIKLKIIDVSDDRRDIEFGHSSSYYLREMCSRESDFKIS